MAHQVPSASAPHASVVRAINGTHAQTDTSAVAHYDGTEVDATGAEQYVDSAVPTTIVTAAAALNRARAILNDHYQRHNAGDGSRFYAHKAADNSNTISAPDMDGAALETTFFTAAKTLFLEIRTNYIAHIGNKKASDGTTVAFHGAVDSTNILGGASTIEDKYDLAIEANNLKAQFTAHMAFTAGGTHGAADVTNAISAANASGDDWDALRTLINELRTDFNAHISNGGGSYHGTSDTFNTIAGAAISYPSGLFTLCDALNTSYTAHRQSTTFHEIADSTNTLAAGTFSTTSVALLISNAALIRTKVNAHIRFAPTSSRALRVV